MVSRYSDLPIAVVVFVVFALLLFLPVSGSAGNGRWFWCIRSSSADEQANRRVKLVVVVVARKLGQRQKHRHCAHSRLLIQDHRSLKVRTDDGRSRVRELVSIGKPIFSILL